MGKKIIAKGVAKAKEIIEEIKKHFFPGNELTLVKCEDVLSAKVCTELRTIAAKLKVKAEEIDIIIRKLVKEKITDAKKIIKKIVVEGVTKAKEIIKKIIEHFFPKPE